MAPRSSVFSLRALNRAFLERQLLLRRRKLSVSASLERLVGMQAQVPTSPYVAMWARLEGFTPDQLARQIERRRAVRIALMRSTIHLVTARDCLALRPVIQPVLDRDLARGAFARNLLDLDMDAVVAAGRAILEERPRTNAELGRLLRERWPDRDATSLAYVIRARVPLVQVPPRGLWGASMQTTSTTAQSWLGRELDAGPTPDRMVARYLAAFGPATVGDVQTWSGLTGLREVVERLRPSLRPFRDERGRELFDVPRAPLPDPDTRAPVRFLPDFDNALLSHADRSRIMGEEHRRLVMANIGHPTVLVDGFVAGTWIIEREGNTATLAIHPFEPPRRKDRTAITEEGARLLSFAAADATRHRVRFGADPAGQ
jgi:DNA glycosylase AlkZ-like